MESLKQTLKRIAEQGEALTRDEARHLLAEILASHSGDEDLEIAALLTALATRGETVEELTGFAEAMRSLSLAIPLTERRAGGTGRYVRHGRRRVGHVQYLDRGGACCGCGRCEGSQTWQSRRDVLLRLGGCVGGNGRTCRARSRTCGRMPASDRVHVPLCAAVASGAQACARNSTRARLSHDLQPRRPPDKSRRRSRAGDGGLLRYTGVTGCGSHGAARCAASLRSARTRRTR